MSNPNIAIVNFGMGNLFSVQNALAHLGLVSEITQKPELIKKADGVILPGVGAFADAMRTLNEHRLDEAIVAFAASGKPLLGICLGAQLLLETSCEFGEHRGLGLIAGSVEALPNRARDQSPIKVPHVGWNRLLPPPDRDWHASALHHLTFGAFMYFVHSYYLKPAKVQEVLATTTYHDHTFASVVVHRNLLACQFHPERSGPDGLQLLANFAKTL